MTEEYIYIVQAEKELDKCKIGITSNLEERLKQYNNITGKSKANIYSYLFTCKVKDMRAVENDIKKQFLHLREEKSKEIYFYNKTLFEGYVNFIKEHEFFIKEEFIKIEPKPLIETKLVKKETVSLDEQGLSPKGVMQKARNVADDEFYTRIEDIEKELIMYPAETWYNKVVFCNCDDAVGDNEKTTSPFALYFLQHFNELGLKKLICTHFKGKVDLFNSGSKAYIFTKEGFSDDIFDGDYTYPKKYDGSFDHPRSLKILNEEADIVCTNPPFSRAIDYWRIVIESGKKFLIISNESNAINTAYIHYFKNKQVWAGYNPVRKFLNPKRQLVEASGRWYTNLPIANR
ncbi:MAG: GIY-YIG nuclease family protein, partial [Spirochaetaceae bacterium]|nr:GIY-YIG nuclease family protein [Spirochaetaceae bacterium]